MNFIPTPSQSAVIAKAINTNEFQKWVVTGKVERFDVEVMIYNGGLEYCNGMIEMLSEVKSYGYKKAIAAFQQIIRQAR